MSDVIDLKKIKRNNFDFSFLKTIQSLVINENFKQGFSKNFDCESDSINSENTDSYVWCMLSAIGEDLGEIIYSDIINYIDLVGNIDLCKVKSLRSMIKELGINYTIFDNFDFIPLEILKVIDVFSISKKYLLDKNVLNEKLVENLKEKVLDDSGENKIFNNLKFKNYLKDIFKSVLSSKIYLTYGLKNDLYIFKNLSDELYISENNKQKLNQIKIFDKFNDFKLKYNIDPSFDEIYIVDHIENGLDFLENYNGFELELLKKEIEFRKSPLFLNEKTTRFKYYKEKKVKEYFNFIETKIYNDNEFFVSDFYKIDHNFIEIKNNKKKGLLIKEPNGLKINKAMLDSVSTTLVDITEYISEAREHIKIQAQQNYMKGTFNLISFVINEYLNNFFQTDKFFIKTLNQLCCDLDQNYEGFNQLSGNLSTILSDIGKQFKQHLSKDIEIVEYDDCTEYFNLKTETTKFAKNKEKVNKPFWKNLLTSDKKTKIENYYQNILNLKINSTNNNFNNVEKFLQTIYNLGADDSYKSDIDGEIKKDTVYEDYIGTEDGKIPYYTFKNQTHPSYQVHPYLFNFIEHGNIISPIINGYTSETNGELEYEFIKNNLSSYIGNYGEVLNLNITNADDFSGYKTRYESVEHYDKQIKPNGANEVKNFDGIFYHKAVQELININEKSELSVLSSNIENQQIYFGDENNKKLTFFAKYFSHLNLTLEESKKIANQITCYFDLIKNIALSSTENKIDIYKYGMDKFGHSYILLKFYNNNTDLNIDNTVFDKIPKLNTTQEFSEYSLENNDQFFIEKQNTLGELWIRLKDHPFAFPAFFGKYPQVETEELKINNRIKNIIYNLENTYTLSSDIFHMRYFYDFDIANKNEFLYLFTCPIFDFENRFKSNFLNINDTNTKEDFFNYLKNNLSSYQLFEKSDILISEIKYEYDSEKQMNCLKLISDKYADIDCIDHPGILKKEVINDQNYKEYFLKCFYNSNSSINFVYLKKINTNQIDDLCIDFKILQYFNKQKLEDMNGLKTYNISSYFKTNNLSIDNDFDFNTDLKLSYLNGKFSFAGIATYRN